MRHHPHPLLAPGNQRGVATLWLAFMLLIMLGFVALGIDVAKLMATRTQLQNAADAAALAGVSAVDPESGVLVQANARTRAQSTSQLNQAFSKGATPVRLLASDVDFPAHNQVRVVVRRDAVVGESMVTHFAQVIGLPTLEVTATATAVVEPAGRVCEGLVPFAAIPPNGETDFLKGCANAYTLFEGQGGSQQGNYLALSFDKCSEGPCAGLGSTGANTFSCLVANGYACCLGVSEWVQTEPGGMSGPFIKALQARFARDEVKTENICYSDYLARGGTLDRVIHIPVVEPLQQGRSDTRVIKFAAFFLRNAPSTGQQKPLTGEFIKDVAVGEIGGPPGDLFAIRLIQ